MCDVSSFIDPADPNVLFADQSLYVSYYHNIVDMRHMDGNFHTPE